jgi:hypothetical protein
MTKLTKKNIYKKRKNSKKRIQKRKRSTVRYFGSGDHTDYTLEQINGMTKIDELKSALTSIGNNFDREKRDMKTDTRDNTLKLNLFIKKMNALIEKYKKIDCKERRNIFGWCPDTSKDPFITTATMNIKHHNIDPDLLEMEN